MPPVLRFCAMRVGTTEPILRYCTPEQPFLVRAEDEPFVLKINFDVLELTENVLAQNAVDLSVHRVGDAFHILYENAAVFPSSLSGDQCRFSPVPVSYESGAIFRRTSAPEVDRIEARRFRT